MNMDREGGGGKWVLLSEGDALVPKLVLWDLGEQQYLSTRLARVSFVTSAYSSSVFCDVCLVSPSVSLSPH